MINSFRRNKQGIVLMIASSLCVCIGQLMWKLSESNILYLIIGFMLYGLGALLMLLAYGHGSLSVLQPMLSLNYVITVVLAYFILNENISFLKCLGIFLVMIGVFLIGGSDE